MILPIFLFLLPLPGHNRISPMYELDNIPTLSILSLNSIGANLTVSHNLSDWLFVMDLLPLYRLPCSFFQPTLIAVIPSCPVVAKMLHPYLNLAISRRCDEKRWNVCILHAKSCICIDDRLLGARHVSFLRHRTLQCER